MSSSAQAIFDKAKANLNEAKMAFAIQSPRLGQEAAISEEHPKGLTFERHE